MGNNMEKEPKVEIELEETTVVEEAVKGEVVTVKNDRFAASVNKRHLPQWALAWIVLVPALLFLVLFMIYPILNTFIIAFFKDFRWESGAGSFAISNIIKTFAASKAGEAIPGQPPVPAPVFGFGNFVKIFTPIRDAAGNVTDMPLFLETIFNTLLIVVISVPLTIGVSLLISALLNSIKVFRAFFQTIFFLPYVTNTIAIGMVFNALFAYGEGQNGIINNILIGMGANPVNWVTDTANKVASGFVIILYSVWNGLAFKILVFMGGLATIDKQYYDAARVDGAKGFTIFRRITLPLISPQILYITITSFIGAFKAYTGVRAVFNNSSPYYFGGPDGTQWMTVVGWIYRDMHLNNASNPGGAAAGSLVLLAIILIITVIQFAVSKKRVHY